jgi:hypothetical protein
MKYFLIKEIQNRKLGPRIIIKSMTRFLKIMLTRKLYCDIKNMAVESSNHTIYIVIMMGTITYKQNTN